MGARNRNEGGADEFDELDDDANQYDMNSARGSHTGSASKLDHNANLQNKRN